MESNLEDAGRETSSKIQEVDVNTADSNGKSPITVTTLYYSCDSNIFQSSESSVKVVSANNYNATVGHRRPNFCELDIITKKENLKLNVDFVPLQTITEELKSLPMSKKLKNSKTGFRKKIYHKSFEGEEEPGEVLCLARVLKDDTSECQPPLTKRSKEACPFISTKDSLNGTTRNNLQEKVEQESQKKKKRRSKSHRSKPERCTNQVEGQSKKQRELDEFGQQTQSLDIFQIPLTTPQFVDLGMAKTMYYAELPNSPPCTEGNLEPKQVEHIQTPKSKTKKSDDKKKKKRKKSKSQNKDTKLEKQEPNSKKNIINKVENEYPPPSSHGSVTTLLSQAYKMDSDVSFASLEPPKSLKTEVRRRHNSPNSEESFLDDVLTKHKTDSAVYGGNYRKKHRTSPKSSVENNVKEKYQNDAIQQPETELRVIYKIDQNKLDTDEKEKKKDKERKDCSRNKKGPDDRSRSTKSFKNKDSKDLHKRRSNSNMKDGRLNDEEVSPEVTKEKSKRHVVDQVAKTNEEESILDIYKKNESLKSESCTMIAVEEYLKNDERKKSHKSRKSKSRSLSPNKKGARKTDSERHKVHAEDLPLLEDTKDCKNKQRSKSRITEENSHKKRCKSKATKTPAEDRSQDLSKRISRRSTSDISKKDPGNFDGHISVEGVQNDSNIAEKKHRRSVSSKNHKGTNKDELVTTTQEVKGIVTFPYKLPEQTVLSMSKEKRKRSKSYTPKKEKLEVPIERPAISSRSHIFDTSQHPSDAHFTKRQSKKVKALAAPEQPNKVVNLKHQPSPKEKFYEELQNISNIQVQESRKRFRVVSRTIRSKLSDESTTPSAEQSYFNKKLSGSRRFKTYICSEKEKEAILNLPIFNKDINQAATIKGENFEEYTVEIEEKRSTRNVKHGHKSGEIEERSKKKKKIRRTVSRKEVTFSHLNVAPMMDLYRKPSRNVFARKALLPEGKPSEFRKINKFIAFKDQPSHLDVSEDTDLSSSKVDPLMKFSIFTIVLGEKILEICTKTIDKAGKITEGFTVSGTEPPKRFKILDPRKDKLKMMATASKLHCTYHPPIEIINSVMKLEPKAEVIKEDPPGPPPPPSPSSVVVVEKDSAQVTKTVSAVTMTDDKKEFDVNEVENKELKDELIQVTYRDNPPSKTPILLKTKRKFSFTTKRKSSNKLNMKRDASTAKLILALRNAQTSTESHSNSDSVIECQTVNSPKNSEVALRQTKTAQKQANSSRISSAVKLMESSLQIIKEESQSTDSSRVSCRVNSVKEVKHSLSEIKETQTDLDVRDIDKIKEVITFLYRSIDAKNSAPESMSTITTNDKVFTKKSDISVSKEESSTESSSYQEQFKNFVRNVTPKFSGLKRNSKQEIRSKTSVCNVNRPRSPIPSRIPMLSRRPSIPQVAPIKSLESATMKISDTLSSSEPSSILSPPKDAKTSRLSKNQKNSVRQRSNSADVLTSGYFEKYRTTKALIEQQRKKRAESADGTVRKLTSPPEPEFKSSTSMSDFSSIIFSFKDDSTSIKSKETDIAAKGSDEKYVQCVLVADIAKQLIDKNIGTITEDEKDLGSKKLSPKQSKSLIAKVKSTLSFEKNDTTHAEGKDAVPDKILSDKSLQTSVIKEEIKQKENDNDRKISILYADVPCQPSTKRRILDEILNRMSSHSFVAPRKSRPKDDIEKPILKRESKRSDLNTFEKMDKFEKIKRVFAGRHENLLKSSLFNCHFSEKRRKPCNCKGPEADYINLMKLERHLEQVLGLYPFIFKAIRSQIDDSTMRKLDKRLKIENPELFTSYDTLATTIDTVSDSFERYPSFSESNINRFNRYCESLNLPGQEYQLQQFIESQNALRQCIKKQFNEKKKIAHQHREGRFSRNKEKSDRIKEKKTSVYAPTDTTSTSSKNNNNNFRPKFAKTFKSKMKKKKLPFKKNGSGLSYISQNPDFCSSSSSNVDDWSIGSPLYSITTPSLNVSFLGRSQSSTSIIKNKPTPVKLTKSNSIMEMSSIQKVNRKFALKQLIEANNIVKTHDNKQNVLVVSVNSSCTVFTTPSKFLAKVEKQLQKSDDTKQQEQNHNPSNNSNTNPNTNNKLRQKTSEKQIDEQSFHSLFFSDSNMKSPTRSEPASHKPFFFHKTNPRVTDEKFPDTLDVVCPTTIAKNTAVAGDEEDLGNFSADSLESNESKQQELGRHQQEDPYQDNSRREFDEYRGDNLYEKKGPQSFFVYSSTVNYSRNVSKNENKGENRQQSNTQNIQHMPPVHAVKTSVGGFINGVENTSKTILSESGYESTKSKRTASIRNFFKKGGSLLDLFRNSSKNKIVKGDNRTTTNFSNIWMKKTEKVIEINQLSGSTVEITEDNCKSRENAPCRSDNTVYWSTIKHISPRKERTTTFGEIASSSRSTPRERSQSPKKNRGTNMPVNNKSCSCSEPSSTYQRQMDECHAYAEKVLLESQMRREGYYKQYQDFKEIPLELLIGKRISNKNKYSQEVSVMTKPKSKPISTQSRRHAKGKGVDATSPAACTQNIAVAANLKQSRPDIVVLRSDSPIKLDISVEKKSRHTSPARPTKEDVQQTSLPYINNDSQPLTSNVLVFRGESRVRLSDARPPVQIHKPPLALTSIPSKPSLKPEDRAFGKVQIRESSSFHDFWRLSKKDKDTSTDRKEKKAEKLKKKDELPLITKFCKDLSKRSRSKSKEKKVDRGCTCDGPPKLPLEKPHQKLRSPPPEVKVSITPSMDVKDIEEDFKPRDMSPSLLMPSPDLDEKSAESYEKEEAMIDMEPVPVEKKPSPESLSSSTTSSLETRESASNDFYIQLLLNDIVDQAMHISEKKVPTNAVHLPPLIKREKHEDIPISEQEEPKEESEICRRSSEDFRKGLTDKEVFDKLLHSFEKEDEIATRLSKDEEFFKDQIKTIKKESNDSIDEEKTGEPNEIIYSEDFGGKHRSTHFWEEKMKVMRAEEENPVKEDDIGTCFSRGFRPDNIALSGDACFSLNKQDRIKFSKGMLTNEESIIDFSERETPLDFLLALGFMVDEASNALKDEDIRSRLLAAITEARVWINKITTTQGTLLYLVAYKSRPKTMRYFLQLVEAIINKRINNAIKLDGFLRVLEKVEEGEIQMINILGADKFEDEENEEKIVKKQLRQLFITVYKIAEKEAMMKGKQLSQQAVVLLRILAAKYRAGLHPHLELIARYIGQDLLNTETQLEAAMIFLSRLDTAEVKLKEFEAYCDIKCEKKKKKSALNNPETILEQSTPLPEHGIAVTGDDTLVKENPAPREVSGVNSRNQEKLERRDKQDKQQKQKKRDDSHDRELGTKKKSNLAVKNKNKH